MESNTKRAEDKSVVTINRVDWVRDMGNIPLIASSAAITREIIFANAHELADGPRFLKEIRTRGGTLVSDAPLARALIYNEPQPLIIGNSDLTNFVGKKTGIMISGQQDKTKHPLLIDLLYRHKSESADLWEYSFRSWLAMPFQPTFELPERTTQT